MNIKVPLLTLPIGSGDIIKAAASALGINQKKGCGCAERQAAMNRALTFVPAKKNEWTKPPAVPDGWLIMASCTKPDKQTILYERKGSFIIWDVINGEYQNSRSFCCETMRAKAVAKWEELCR